MSIVAGRLQAQEMLHCNPLQVVNLHVTPQHALLRGRTLPCCLILYIEQHLALQHKRHQHPLGQAPQPATVCINSSSLQ